MPPIQTTDTLPIPVLLAHDVATDETESPTSSQPRPAADQPSGLTMFFLNIVMIIVIGCLTMGMQFALYAALLMAPIWLVAITLLVVFAADPEASLSE